MTINSRGKFPVGLDVLARPTKDFNRKRRRPNSSPPRTGMLNRENVQPTYRSTSHFNELPVSSAPYDILKKLESSIIFQESNEDKKQIPEQISSFCPQPPSEPMRLIILGKVPEMYTNISSQHNLQSTTKTDEELLGIINPDPDSYYFYSPSSRISMSSTYQKLNLKNSSTTDQNKNSKTSKCVVRSLLQQLFADLNLATVQNLKQNADKFEKASSELPPLYPRLRPHRHSSPPSRAHNSEMNKKSRNSSSGTGDEPGPVQDEWIGGVRALRDCCVRLVLRQLRHINRLNRAIDRSLLRPRSAYACKSNNIKRSNETILSYLK